LKNRKSFKIKDNGTNRFLNHQKLIEKKAEGNSKT